MPASDTTIINACRTASSYAGLADEGWNRRFINALDALGFELVEREADYDSGEICTPGPWREGWQYVYPSAIARKPECL
jgi:hypothetical protein